MHLAFIKTEKVIKEHYDDGQLYARDAFESIISDISSLCLPKLCCDVHREGGAIVPQLIYEFCVIRCRFIGKILKSDTCDHLNTESHTIYDGWCCQLSFDGWLLK